MKSFEHVRNPRDKIATSIHLQFSLRARTRLKSCIRQRDKNRIKNRPCKQAFSRPGSNVYNYISVGGGTPEACFSTLNLV